MSRWTFWRIVITAGTASLWCLPSKNKKKVFFRLEKHSQVFLIKKVKKKIFFGSNQLSVSLRFIDQPFFYDLQISISSYKNAQRSFKLFYLEPIGLLFLLNFREKFVSSFDPLPRSKLIFISEWIGYSEQGWAFGLPGPARCFSARVKNFFQDWTIQFSVWKKVWEINPNCVSD